MKTSNKFAIMIVVIFIILPCFSYFLMKSKVNATRTELSGVARQLTVESLTKTRKADGSMTVVKNIQDTIKCVDISGKAVSPTNIYVVSTLGNDNTVSLNCEASTMKIRRDTLFISIDDPSRIYHGKIELKGLRTAIINTDTVRFH